MKANSGKLQRRLCAKYIFIITHTKISEPPGLRYCSQKLRISFVSAGNQNLHLVIVDHFLTVSHCMPVRTV